MAKFVIYTEGYGSDEYVMANVNDVMVFDTEEKAKEYLTALTESDPNAEDYTVTAVEDTYSVAYPPFMDDQQEICEDLGTHENAKEWCRQHFLEWVKNHGSKKMRYNFREYYPSYMVFNLYRGTDYMHPETGFNPYHMKEWYEEEYFSNDEDIEESTRKSIRGKKMNAAKKSAHIIKMRAKTEIVKNGKTLKISKGKSGLPVCGKVTLSLKKSKKLAKMWNYLGDKFEDDDFNAIREIVEANYTEDDYEELLTDVYGSVDVGYTTFDVGYIIRNLDETAFEIGMNEEIDTITQDIIDSPEDHPEYDLEYVEDEEEEEEEEYDASAKKFRKLHKKLNKLSGFTKESDEDPKSEEESEEKEQPEEIPEEPEEKDKEPKDEEKPEEPKNARRKAVSKHAKVRKFSVTNGGSPDQTSYAGKYQQSPMVREAIDRHFKPKEEIDEVGLMQERLDEMNKSRRFKNNVPQKLR